MGSELGDDLWDAASLDYPGRDSPNGGGGDMMRSGGVGHPHHGDGWEFMNQVFWQQKKHIIGTSCVFLFVCLQILLFLLQPNRTEGS